MNILQKELDNALSDAPYEMVANIIVDKIASKGISLTARERDYLLKQLKTEESETIIIRKWPWWNEKQIDIELSNKEIEECSERLNEFFKKQLPNLVQSATEDISEDIFHTLKKNWRAEKKRQSREVIGFEKRLHQRWSKAIDLLKMMVVISREFGENVSTTLHNDKRFTSSAVLEVLTRLHARACQICDEIVCLISSGFADGTMARWRTLHEIAAVACLINEHGEELARRYIDHQVVESYKAAIIYQECAEQLGYEPLSHYELEGLQQVRDDMIYKYGISFKKQYGWAADALNIKDPKLSDIEKAVGIGHLRAHYKMASHNVHPNPKGIYFKLGLPDDTDLLLSGPSNFGLADPGHCTAISLLQVTVALAFIKVNLDSLVVSKILHKLEREIGEAFYKADQELKNDII